jgi:hypothetical protein
MTIQNMSFQESQTHIVPELLMTSRKRRDTHDHRQVGICRITTGGLLDDSFKRCRVLRFSQKHCDCGAAIIENLCVAAAARVTSAAADF